MERRTELLRENTKKSLLTDQSPKKVQKHKFINKASLGGTIKKKKGLTVCPPSHPGFRSGKPLSQTPQHISAKQRQAIN